MTHANAADKPATRKFESLAEIPRFPFDRFDEMQAAIEARSFNVGVDSFAAAAASIVAAVLTGDYLLLLAIPVQAFSFYLSQPSSPIRKWVTVAGAASLAVFLNFLFNRWMTAATLVAYAGLTFA